MIIYLRIYAIDLIIFYKLGYIKFTQKSKLFQQCSEMHILIKLLKQKGQKL